MAVSSTIADHCSSYALSDSSEGACFETSCEHEHRDACSRCEEIVSVFRNIEEGLDKVVTSSAEERDDLSYTISLAKEDIRAWKAHQLRLMNQEVAKKDAISQLDDKTVLMVQDWAMKFLPMKYRESQTQWFGKRGIPWHITVILRSKDGVIESETLVHVFNPTTQDSATVAAIMQHCVQVCKHDMPSLEEIYYISDNAGCYHCSTTIQAVLGIAEATGVHIRRVDFTEAQGGKGACDRKAATIKNHVRIYVNQGNNVETADQFKDAVESHGGVPGVKVFVCKVQGKVPTQNPIVGISHYSNFELTDGGLLVWKAYKVGQGKLIQSRKLAKLTPPVMNISHVSSSASAFQPLKPRRQQANPSSDSESSDEESESANTGHQEMSDKTALLFPCPEEGCIKVYRRFNNLQAHLTCANHKRAPDRETLHDRAKILYGEKMTSTTERQAPGLRTATSDIASDDMPSKGFALSKRKVQSKFSAKQKNYLNSRFDEGEITGSKADPKRVSKEMRYAMDMEGNRLFGLQEFLSPQQVSSYFSRVASSVRGQASAGNNIEDLQATENAVQSEESSREIRCQVLDQVALTHPIVSHSYNLCELVRNHRLQDLNLRVMKMLCSALGVDETTIPDKRKKSSYQDQLEQLVRSCSCSKEYVKDN